MLYELRKEIIKTALLLPLFMISMTGLAGAAAEEVYTADGILMETLLDTNGVPTDAIAVFNIVIPDDNSLVVPMTFAGNEGTVVLQAYFNDTPIEILSGILGKSENIDYLILDTNSYRNQTGELKLVLQNSGTEVAELFIIESVNYAEPAPSANTLTSSDGGGSVSLLGLCMIGLIGVVRARRKKS